MAGSRWLLLSGSPKKGGGHRSSGRVTAPAKVVQNGRILVFDFWGSESLPELVQSVQDAMRKYLDSFIIAHPVQTVQVSRSKKGKMNHQIQEHDQSCSHLPRTSNKHVNGSCGVGGRALHCEAPAVNALLDDTTDPGHRRRTSHGAASADALHKTFRQGHARRSRAQSLWKPAKVQARSRAASRA